MTSFRARHARLAILLATACAWAWTPADGQAQAKRVARSARPAEPAEIRDVHRTRLREAVRITIELEREAPYRSERLDGPPRLFFDFLGTRPAKTLVEGTLSYHDDVVRHVRVGRHPNDVTRVVLDLVGVQRYSIFALYNPYRLVIDCVREAPAPRAASPAKPAAASVRPEPPAPPVERAGARPAGTAPAAPERVEEAALSPADVSPAAGDVVMFSRRPRSAYVPLAETAPPSRPEVETADTPAPDTPAPDTPAAHTGEKPTAHTGEKPPAPASRPAAKPTAPAARPGEKPIAPAPLKNGFSLARQLGLGASRIVIDPGHGGRDPGAQARGASEKTIVLDIALRLEKLLKGAGMEVVLTRRTDRYLSLEERTELANSVEGDLFLSLHANASRNTKAQGIETYVLNFASNPEAEAVAARENASSERTMSSLNGILQAIALNNKLDESRGFAASVQSSLVRRLRATRRQVKDLGVKQAPFVVLIGAEMPSVLVEVSFMTHLQEGRLLRTAVYRQRVAEALFEGIRGYRRSLKRAQSVPRE